MGILYILVEVMTDEVSSASIVPMNHFTNYHNNMGNMVLTHFLIRWMVLYHFLTKCRNNLYMNFIAFTSHSHNTAQKVSGKVKGVKQETNKYEKGLHYSHIVG
mmetsp:Transcript_24143/g.35406  ORF Transcript_24143/g.35406 Transcript_24143/m.35406 type:complete len:103 (+) Transcript_24143:621-929(+)